VEELVRVGRRKLEELILAATEDTNPAKVFFDQVMSSTGATVLWPTKLKIGATSRKDPNVKIIGTPSAVTAAKDRILRELDTKSMRITVKMDIPHNEHSHIIGVGGKTVRRISDETNCHIHFPDSNRSAGGSMKEKSNQVSINGGVHSVELARVRIRNLLPITIDCQIPLQTQFDPHAPALQQFMTTYGVRIAVRYASPKSSFMGSPTVQCTVEGTQENVEGIKSVIIKLHEYYGSRANPTTFPVSLQLSVPSQHKETILGQTTLRNIMMRTGTEVLVDHHHSRGGLTKVSIEGTVTDVLLARQQLIGCFPLVLMFDVTANHKELDDADFLQEMMQKLDVYISVKPKYKQKTKSVLIKSLEQNSHCVYEARAYILTCSPNGSPEPVPHTTSEPSPMEASVKIVTTPVETPVPPTADATTPPGDQDKTDMHVDDPHSSSNSNSSGYGTGSETSDQSEVSKLPKMASERSPSPKTVTICDPAESKVKTVSKLTEVRRSPSPVRHQPNGGRMELGVSPRYLKDYEQRKVQAREAMRQRIDPEVPRYPTTSWCGDLLSNSTTTVELRRTSLNNKERVSQMTMDFRRDSQVPCGLRSLTQPTLKKMLAAPPLEERSLRSVDVSNVEDVAGLIRRLKLDEKYLRCFQEQEITEIDDVFLSLSEKDLTEIGITTVGAKRTLILAIRDLKLRRGM
jgi:protein bicaudal C